MRGMYDTELKKLENMLAEEKIDHLNIFKQLSNLEQSERRPDTYLSYGLDYVMGIKEYNDPILDTMYLSGLNYEVEKDIVIDGGTLIIASNTQLNFKKGTGIIIKNNGKLFTLGAKGSIKFTSEGDWKGITANDSYFGLNNLSLPVETTNDEVVLKINNSEGFIHNSPEQYQMVKYVNSDKTPIIIFNNT